MATDGVENPNQFDEPEQRQVMSPNATTTQGNDPGQRPSMNGVQGPLRGSQDIDGEVLAGASDRERFPPASAQPQSGGTPGAATLRTMSNRDHLCCLDLTGQAVSTTTGAPERQADQQPGLLAGVMRAVHTLPTTVENLVARSLSGQSASHSPAHYDSVEYASVRTSSERPIPPPAQSHSGEAPLLDAPTLLRLQQMAQRAPLLYPTDSLEYAGQPAGMSDQVPMAPRTPPPPSTTSSELQAEVRRQLSELMAARDEESRRLRA
eukprot:s3478_g1.t1